MISFELYQVRWLRVRFTSRYRPGITSHAVHQWYAVRVTSLHWCRVFPVGTRKRSSHNNNKFFMRRTRFTASIVKASSPNHTTPPRASIPIAMATSRIFALPAVLRIQIYELAFAPIDCEPKQISKFRLARPPSPSLLLACRQLYNDASQLYQAARQYWSNHANRLTLKTLDEVRQLSTYTFEIQDADLNRITNLELTLIPSNELDENRQRDQCSPRAAYGGLLIPRTLWAVIKAISLALIPTRSTWTRRTLVDQRPWRSKYVWSCKCRAFSTTNVGTELGHSGLSAHVGLTLQGGIRIAFTAR